MPPPAHPPLDQRTAHDPLATDASAPTGSPDTNDRRTEWLGRRHLHLFAAAVWAANLIGSAVLLGPRAGGLGLGLSGLWFAIVWILAWRPPGIPKFQFHFHHEDPVRVQRTDPLTQLPIPQRLGAATLAAAGVSLLLLIALHLLRD
jgi:hypothetical protein